MPDHPVLNDRVIAELLRMPKQPADDLAVSLSEQVKAMAVICMVLLLLSGLLYLVSLVAPPSVGAGHVDNNWQFAAIVLLCIVPTPMAITIGMGLFAYMTSRHLQGIRHGMYYVCWKYDTRQWQSFVESRQSNARLVLWVIVGISPIGGLGFAAMAHSDNNLIGDSLLKTYLVPALIAICAGIAIAGICFYLGGITQRLLQRRTAQCIIGDEGLYITGQYWPWSAVGQCLESVSIGDENQLSFTFRTSRNATGISVPIPPGEQAVAAAIVRLLDNR